MKEKKKSTLSCFLPQAAIPSLSKFHCPMAQVSIFGLRLLILALALKIKPSVTFPAKTPLGSGSLGALLAVSEVRASLVCYLLIIKDLLQLRYFSCFL